MEDLVVVISEAVLLRCSDYHVISFEKSLSSDSSKTSQLPKASRELVHIIFCEQRSVQLAHEKKGCEWNQVDGEQDVGKSERSLDCHLQLMTGCSVCGTRWNKLEQRRRRWCSSSSSSGAYSSGDSPLPSLAVPPFFSPCIVQFSQRCSAALSLCIRSPGSEFRSSSSAPQDSSGRRNSSRRLEREEGRTNKLQTLASLSPLDLSLSRHSLSFSAKLSG